MPQAVLGEDRRSNFVGAAADRERWASEISREILESITNSTSYRPVQARLVAAGNRLSRLYGGERSALWESFDDDA